MAVLNEGESFGEENLADSSLRNYTIICQSGKGVLIEISKKVFVQRILQEENTVKIVGRIVNKINMLKN